VIKLLVLITAATEVTVNIPGAQAADSESTCDWTHSWHWRRSVFLGPVLALVSLVGRCSRSMIST